MKIYKSKYLKHNDDVEQYFINRPDDFLKINVADSHSYKAMCEFLGHSPKREKFEWKNQT